MSVGERDIKGERSPAVRVKDPGGSANPYLGHDVGCCTLLMFLPRVPRCGAARAPGAHQTSTQLPAMRTAAAFVSLWGLACQQHVCGFVVNTPALRQRSSHGAASRATSALSMKAGPNPKVRWTGHKLPPAAAQPCSRQQAWG